MEHLMRASSFQVSSAIFSLYDRVECCAPCIAAATPAPSVSTTVHDQCPYQRRLLPEGREMGGLMECAKSAGFWHAVLCSWSEDKRTRAGKGTKRVDTLCLLSGECVCAGVCECVCAPACVCSTLMTSSHAAVPASFCSSLPDMPMMAVPCSSKHDSHCRSVWSCHPTAEEVQDEARALYPCQQID